MTENEIANAFPIHGNNNIIAEGLTKLEYFTALAMQGILANQALVDSMNIISIEWIAKRAVNQAVETLKQLEDDKA